MGLNNIQTGGSGGLSDGGLRNLTEISGIPDSEALHAHYDFSQYSGTSGFSDLSNNGNDLVNGSITGVGDSINGVQAGEFDATDDGVWSNSFTSISQPFEVIAVTRVDSVDANDIVQLSSTGDVLVSYNNSDYWWIFAGTLLEGSSDRSANLITGVFDEGASVIRENGGQTASGDVGTAAMDIVSLGSRQPSGNAVYLDGAIGEVFVFNDRLSSSKRGQFESYLADKWGVTI